MKRAEGPTYGKHPDGIDALPVNLAVRHGGDVLCMCSMEKSKRVGARKIWRDWNKVGRSRRDGGNFLARKAPLAFPV